MLEKRPSFKTGTQFVPTRSAIRVSLPPPISGRRDDRFTRPSFKRSDPKPRGLKSIEQIERLKTKQEGIKIRLGESTLGDIKIKKKDRLGNIILDAAGLPVFETVKLNFGLLAQMFEGSFKQNMDKLQELATAIETGATSSTADINALTVSISRLLRNQETIASMTETQLKFITRSLQLLGISRDPEQAGIQDLVDKRFVTNAGWERAGGRNKGPIIMFLLANVSDKPRLSPNRPIFGRSGDPIQLISIFAGMADTHRPSPLVMDLIDKTMHNSLRAARISASAAPDIPISVFPLDPRPSPLSGVSLEEEDEFGALSFLPSVPDPIVSRDESVIARLSRETLRAEAVERAAREGALVPFDARAPISTIRSGILAAAAITKEDLKDTPPGLKAGDIDIFSGGRVMANGEITANTLSGIRVLGKIPEVRSSTDTITKEMGKFDVAPTVS